MRGCLPPLVLMCAVAAPCRAQLCGEAIWSPLTRLGPGLRHSTAMAFNEATGKAILYGGGCSGGLECGTNHGPYPDTWEWDGAAWQLRDSIGPLPVRGTVGAYDPWSQWVIIFGGYAEAPIPTGTFLGDTWGWTGSSWVQVSTTGPSARSIHAMASDSGRSVVVLFGGYHAALGDLGDTWEWTGIQWIPRATTGPAKRIGHAMAYDKVRRRTVLFGGDGPSGHLGDTWEWDGSAWTEVTVPAPPARRDHSMAFDSTRGRVLMFGGWVGQLQATPGDLWEWDGASWQQLSMPGPSARMADITFDTWRGRLVLYGGLYLTCCSFQTFGDTWEFAWPVAPSVYQNPLSLSIVPGTPAQFSAASLGAPPLSWQWRREGVPLVNGGGISGATTSHLTIAAASSTHAGAYDVAVTNACGSTISAPAALAVGCYPDCTGDGRLTVGDFACFQTKFVLGAPYADCNGQGGLTVADFGCFQTAFVAGCP